MLAGAILAVQARTVPAVQEGTVMEFSTEQVAAFYERHGRLAREDAACRSGSGVRCAPDDDACWVTALQHMAADEDPVAVYVLRTGNWPAPVS